MGFLTREELEHIKTHKYVGGKYSWLDNKLNPFWYSVAESFPNWLAPNLITLIGFFFLISSYLLIIYYDTGYSKDLPRWTYIYMAFTIFIYQTLDAADGKQARRTNSATPLGQLFDHGCDAFATAIFLSIASQFLRMGSSMIMVWLFVGMMTSFFFAAWEEIFTGVVKTAVGNLGVTEGQLTFCGALIITGIFGSDVWQLNLLQGYQFSILQFNISYFSLTYLFIIISVLGILVFMINILQSVWKNAKNRVDALLMLLPLAILFVLSICWAYTPLFQRHPALATLSVGLIFFNLTSKIIICSMAKATYPKFQLLPFILLIPMIHYYLCLNDYCDFWCKIEHDFYLYIILLGIIMVVDLVFITRFIKDITKYLGIYCFIISKRRTD